MCQICDAKNVLRARQRAAMPDSGGEVVAMESLRPLLIGTGLQLEQVGAASTREGLDGARWIRQLQDDPDVDWTDEECIVTIVSNTWIEGLLLGLFIRDRERENEAREAAEAHLPPEERISRILKRGVQQLFPGMNVEIVDEASILRWLQDTRPPLWTRNCKGVREAERDRRRRARRSR